MQSEQTEQTVQNHQAPAPIVLQPEEAAALLNHLTNMRIYQDRIEVLLDGRDPSELATHEERRYNGFSAAALSNGAMLAEDFDKFMRARGL